MFHVKHYAIDAAPRLCYNVRNGMTLVTHKERRVPIKTSVYFTEDDIETLRMVGEKYPNAKGNTSRLVREVLQEWRNRQDESRSKDAKIDKLLVNDEVLLDRTEQILERLSNPEDTSIVICEDEFTRK